MSEGDTIYALASGSLPAGIAVLRISGSSANKIERFLDRPLPLPRLAKLRDLHDGDGKLLDRVLVLWMPGPGSFTGEDCLELHLHGGLANVRACKQMLSLIPGFREAEAGEFTQRAFVNGKIDLYEAEALGDLIQAETEQQRQLALHSSKSELGKRFADWRESIMHARAMIEAELDFSDEDDVPDALHHDVFKIIDEVVTELKEAIKASENIEIVRQGYRVVLAGPPNAGKSSLMNALAKRDVAIVTDIAGTTRDLIELSLDIKGHKVTLTDTAGVRPDADSIEKLGIEKAQAAMQNADLLLELIPPGYEPDNNFLPVKPVRIQIASKCDLSYQDDAIYDISVSSTTGRGVDELINLIGNHLDRVLPVEDWPVFTRYRHIELAKLAVDSLRTGNTILFLAPELAAEEYRQAANAIGKISGQTDVEDLLGVIFSQFCVGK